MTTQSEGAISEGEKKEVVEIRQHGAPSAVSSPATTPTASEPLRPSTRHTPVQSQQATLSLLDLFKTATLLILILLPMLYLYKTLLFPPYARDEPSSYRFQRGTRDSWSFFQTPDTPRTRDVTIQLTIGLENIYTGRPVMFSVKKSVLCPVCGGKGSPNPEDVQTCPYCHGKGMRVARHQVAPGFIMTTQETCRECGGSGEIMLSKCSHCGGSKVVHEVVEHELEVPLGMPEGHVVVLPNAADQAPGYVPGDLRVMLKTRPHPNFRRGEGEHSADLYYSKFEISLLEALVGFEKTIVHLDGHIVVVKRTEITPNKFVIELPREGLPVYGTSGNYGSLFVEVSVVFPKSLSKEQKQMVLQLLPATEEIEAAEAA